MDLKDLDFDRIVNYFQVVLNRSTPSQEDIEDWHKLLTNSDLLVELDNKIYTSVVGLLLFGNNPNRRLPQAGITATAFKGTQKDYNINEREFIHGPLVPYVNKDKHILNYGVIDEAVNFVRRNMGSIAWLDGARRIQKKAYPIEAIREAITNAVMHRDYSREGTDIEVSIYDDRVEVISPGGLPNGVTIEKIKEGVVRVARNEILKNILRDYDYAEHLGMGVRDKMIQSMINHGSSPPEFVDEEDRFKVCLPSALTSEFRAYVNSKMQD